MTSAISALTPQAASFWEIQRSFIQRSFDLPALQDGLMLFAAAVTVISLLMLFFAIRNRTRPYVPQDWILDPKEILATIQRALDQRAKFELQFASVSGTRRPALRCSGVEVRGSVLVLEATGLTHMSESWAGRSVDCFFLLTSKDLNMFHAFTTSVESVHVVKDLCFIQLHMPQKIEARQKRSYLRIVPPDEYLLGAAIWRGPDQPEEQDRNTLNGWAKPSLILLPGTRTDFTVRDISSGGLRVHLPRESLGEEMPHINTSNQMMLMLDLWDPDKMLRLRFWMLCRVQNPVLDFETRGMDIGLQFLAWAKPQEINNGSALVWLRLSASGEVEPLGNWIMRRHLEFFRETEQLSTAAGSGGNDS